MRSKQKRAKMTRFRAKHSKAILKGQKIDEEPEIEPVYHDLEEE